MADGLWVWLWSDTHAMRLTQVRFRGDGKRLLYYPDTQGSCSVAMGWMTDDEYQKRYRGEAIAP